MSGKTLDPEANSADALDRARANLIGAEAAALAEDDDVQALQRVAQKGAAVADPDDDDDDAGDGDSGDSAGAASGDAANASGDGAAAGGDSGAAGGDDAAAELPPLQRAAVYMPVPDITELDAKEQGLKEQRTAIREKYKAGEIDLDARDEELDKLNDQQREIDRVRDRHATATEYNHNLSVSIYVGRINAQKAAAKADGIDYDASPVLMNAWDAQVKALSGDENWTKKGDAAILAEAHRLVVAQIKGVAEKMGLRAGAPAPAPAPNSGKPDGKAAIRDAVNARKPDAKGVRPLSTLPNAANENPGGDNEFADFDNASGMELEALLAANPKKAERWIAQQ